MQLTPTDEQTMLGDAVARLLADGDVEPGAGPISAAAWRNVAELGIPALLLPEHAGGLGGGADDLMIVAETFGRALAITPLGEGIAGAADLIARHGDAATIDRFVAPVLAGDAVLALATGASQADGDSVSGHYPFVRWMPRAAAVVLLQPDAAYVVEADGRGLVSVPARLADGTPAASITLSDCAATRIALPAGEMARTLAAVDLAHAAEMTGAMALLYAQTADYIATRRQFGSAIATFQAIQHRSARMYVALEQSRSAVLRAAATGRDEAGFVRAATAAKAYVAVAAQRLAEDAVQLHGGIGVTDALPVGRGLRRILVLGRLFGSAAAARATLAA